MADADTLMWRNVLLAGARGLEYTFKAIGNALAGEQPVEVSGFSGDHDAAPSQSGVTGRKKKGKKGKKGEEEAEEPKAKRAPSAYNLFVAEQMKLRKAANPEIPNKEHFRAVAKDWKTSSQNKKNFPGASEAPAATEDPHLEDFEDDEAEGLLERTSEGGDNNEADAEVAGRRGSPAKEVEEEEKEEKAEKAEKEKEKKDKKKRKKERQADAQEDGGTGYHRDEEEAAAEKRSSKKGKR